VDTTIRPLHTDELPTVIANDARAFGITYHEQDLEDIGLTLEPDRSLVAADGDELVGFTSAYTFGLSLPGGASIPAGGVTWVSVAATHRRRGILRALMDRQLDDLVERGDTVAILTASDSGIYGRFGYGVASHRARLVVDTERLRLHDGVGDEATVRFATAAEARPHLEASWARLQATVPATVSRSARWWQLLGLDREHRRDGRTGPLFVVHPDGYVRYRLEMHHEWGRMASKLLVEELVALTPAAHGALWRFLLGVDLVTTLEWGRCPADEPLRWLAENPREVKVTGVDDDVWVRPLDVERLLSSRRYEHEGRLVLEIVDRFKPALGGRFALEADGGAGGGAACWRTTAAPDLVLGAPELGSISLGGVPITTLVAAGRVVEAVPGAARRADDLFLSTPRPHNQTAF
jgi:predicted acetyltransferase